MTACLVTLEPSEIRMAAYAGVQRCMEAIERGARPRFGHNTNRDWQDPIEGALGECAVAKYRNVYWPGAGVYGGIDVGDCEVRTRSKHTYDLILHPSDADYLPYWLVTGSRGTYRIWGWIRGADGKMPAYWGDPAGGRPAFFVPKNVLTPPEVPHV